MTAIKAITTVYKGYKFRSRLEARWAVFFDAMGIEWEYEKEGFDVGIMGAYLPDFWLPQVNMWAEVKPAPFVANAEGIVAIVKAKKLAVLTGHSCLMLYGVPDFKCYEALTPYVYDPSVPDEDQDFETSSMTYVVSSAGHDYVWDEHRFYSSPLDEKSGDGLMEDPGYIAAVYAARQARFEHGEKG